MNFEMLAFQYRSLQNRQSPNQNIILTLEAMPSVFYLLEESSNILRHLVTKD